MSFSLKLAILILFLIGYAVGAHAQNVSYQVNIENQGQFISVDKEEAAGSVYHSIEGRNWPNRCESFSSKRGYGPWANLISVELSKTQRYMDLLYGTQDIADFCPNYPMMKVKDRFNVWVVILLNMSYYESSCDQTAKSEGPNGPVAGLFQLHAGQESLYAGGCRRGDSLFPGGSIRCSLSMLQDQIHRDGRLFSTKSYWEVLRPQGPAHRYYLIEAALLGFKPCRVQK
jgi:hypothetical protein